MRRPGVQSRPFIFFINTGQKISDTHASLPGQAVESASLDRAISSRMSAWSSSLLGCALLLFFFLIINVLHRKKKSKLPPGPPGWPIVGNLFQLGKRPHESLFHLAQRYGPLITLRLGMLTTVVVSSPEIVKEMFKHNDQAFAGRHVNQVFKCSSYYESSLAFNPYGPRWRMLRKICNADLLSTRRLNAVQHLRRDLVSETIRQIHSEDYLKAKAVNIGQSAFFISLNVICNMIFSRNIFGRESEDAEELKEIMSKTSQVTGTFNLADFFPFLQVLDPQGVCRDMEICLKRVYAILDKIIDERISHNSSHNAANHGDFLDVVLGHITDGADENSKFTRADVTPLLYTLFLAGSETTATTIEWTMAELVRKPQMMKRAQAELEDAVGRERRVEESDIQNLRYLEAVLKEAFRLHPVFPLLLPHRAESTCEVAGYVIPKHSQVIVNVWGIGRDPKVWERPLEFDPERFLQREMEYKGNDCELIPFGTGRRICPGLPMASRTVKFVLASLLHSFDWSPPLGQSPEKIDMTEKFGTALQKMSPLILNPSPRLPTALY